MKFFERIYPIATAIIIVLLVLYFSPTDVTGRYDHKKAMAVLDINQDQQLDNSEMDAVFEFMEKAGVQDNIALDDIDAQHRDFLKLIDMDEDGILNADEKANAQAHIKSLDKDLDGFISLKELK